MPQCGEKFSCAISDTGKVYCWGDGYDFQIGSGQGQGTFRIPTEVSGLVQQPIIAITASWKTSCAISYSGALYCWGACTEGQCGTQSQSNVDTAQVFDLGTNEKAASVAIGRQHACVLLRSGNIKVSTCRPHRRLHMHD